MMVMMNEIDSIKYGRVRERGSIYILTYLTYHLPIYSETTYLFFFCVFVLRMVDEFILYFQ